MALQRLPAAALVLQGDLLVNSGTGRCLAIGHGKATPGKTAVQWKCTGGAEQGWPAG
ncbi:RICIN domain-containing protein [Nonomuraea mesophila]|uniref:RICIN domain-containing protein n=1 Tax=Nonomuraea mesophila TaxID=2530382 RepID=UPI00140A14A9|nr:RICIN domain-containing protein [Nonomuraea mesophila]